MPAIEITDKEVKVHGRYIIKHDYYLHRVPSLMYALYQLRDQFKTKKLYFFFDDGEPIKFCGFDKIIDQTVLMLNLTSDQIIVSTCDQSFVNSKVTVKYTPSSYFIGLKNQNGMLNWELDFDAVLFGAVYGRFTLERFLLAHYLETQYSDESFVIFHPGQYWVSFDVDGLQPIFDSQMAWYNNRIESKANLTAKGDVWVGGDAGLNDIFDNYKNIWSKYYIEIVAETDCYNGYYFTEKTIKCLLSKKPFILLSGMGAIKNLQDMGFKTFHPYIDETYDLEPDTNKRLELIKKEISRIYSLTTEEKIKLFTNISPILINNQTNYIQIVENYNKKFNDNLNS